MPPGGRWAPIYQSLWTHRKTFELAALLGLNETYAAAHVARLWCWSVDNAPDGDVSGLSDRAIAYGAGWTHEASLFVNALLTVGFLDQDKLIHDWDDYAGKLIERREKDAERKKTSRGHAPDVHGTSNGVSGLVRRRQDETRQDETRVPEIASPQPPPPAEGERRSRRRRGRTGVDVDPFDAAPSPSEDVDAVDVRALQGTLSPLAPTDAELWERCREQLKLGMSAANWAQLVEPLEPLGRAPNGGLYLRAPPGQGIGKRALNHVRKALHDQGEAAAVTATIVER